MAIGFGSAYGTGATNQLTLSPSTSGNLRTYAFICFNTSLGGGSRGRVLDQTQLLFFKSGSTNLQYTRHFSNVPEWEFNCPDNTVNSIVLTHDISGLNNPRVWRNGAEITATTVTSPSGTAATLSSTLCVGNRTVGDRNWDGWIARLAIWTSILPDTACASISRGFSPIKYSPSTLDFYLPMLRQNRDVSRNARAITVTGTAFQTHPRVLGGYR